MPEFRCVKCGVTAETNDSRWRKNRDCAPACDQCREAVTKETRKRFSMWPSEYHGGWLWSKGQWWPVKTHDGRIDAAKPAETGGE
jgi:hypothetical protein